MGKKKRKKEWVWQNKTKKRKKEKGHKRLLCMSFNVKMKRPERKRWKKIMLKNDFFNLSFLMTPLKKIPKLSLFLHNFDHNYLCD